MKISALNNSNGIYLDYAATSPVLPEAAGVMADILTELYANPSSVHAAGIEAREIVEASRGQVLKLLGVRHAEQGSLFFTGSGTEASNTVLFGVYGAKKWRVQPTVITDDSEHPSIDEPLKRLEACGVKAVRIPTRGGILDFDALGNALESSENVILASFMLVNNETGALYDVKAAFDEVRRRHTEALCHCDAIQGFGKLNFTPESLGADMLSVSAHKLGGPKGIGALYVAKPVLTAKRIIPYILGGGQENGMRSGTENVAAVAGFGAAAEYNLSNSVSDKFIETTAALRAETLGMLPGAARVNTPSGKYMPHIMSITLPGKKSEVTLRYLSGLGIYVSSGSACASRHRGISRALTAFGLRDSDADSTIRVSFSDKTPPAHLHALADALNEWMAK